MAPSGVKVTAIANPNSGPGAALDTDYRSAVQAFQAAGGKVLGYVYSCYGNNNCVQAGETRSVVQVLEEASRYRSWYGVDGIFLDEVSGSELAFYQQAVAGLANTGAGYGATVRAPWDASAAPDRLAHAYHTVGTAADMQALVQQAAQRGAGHIYITEQVMPNPYAQLPVYWQAEVAAVQALNAAAVPEPATWATVLAGLVLTTASAHRRRKPA